MRLSAGGGELSRHADVTDPDAGVANGRLMRIHVPIVTNPDVWFSSWWPTGTVVTEQMRAGTVWYLDTRKPHTAVNRGTTPRIHLVMDVHANAALRDLVKIPGENT